MLLPLALFASAVLYFPAGGETLSANSDLCQQLLKNRRVAGIPSALLLPPRGPSLNELFPYDLLSRDFPALPDIHPELMDLVALMLAAPNDEDISEHVTLLEASMNSRDAELFIRTVQHTLTEFRGAKAENRVFMYRWKNLNFLPLQVRLTVGNWRDIFESPVRLLAREMQLSILSLVRDQLSMVGTPRAVAFRSRINFLLAQARHTRFTLTQIHGSEGEEPLKVDPRPDRRNFLRHLEMQGLEPSYGGIRTRMIWEYFLREVVAPRLPLSNGEYFKLLDQYVEIIPQP